MTTQVTQQEAKTILFTHYGSDWIRGSERCLLDLIKHLDKQQFKALLWCNQPIMMEAAKALDIEVYCSDFPLLFGWQAPRYDIPGFFRLVNEALQLIKTHDVDLIHANSAAPCQWLTFASQISNVPLICHMHSTYQLRDRLSLCLYQTELVVGVSQYVVDPLLKDNKPSAEVSVIANGIDTQRLLNQPLSNLRDDLNLTEDHFVLACLGSLIHRKGVDLLLQATAQLLAQGVPVHLLVLGEGPEYEQLQTQAEQLAISENVTLFGECENAVGVLRGSADLFVSAAREEAFGLVFAEASLAGLAIVAPDTGGIANVVLDQKSGLLVPTEDMDALVGAIHKLYLNPELREQMAKSGRQHVYDNFTIEQNSKRFQALYNQRIANPTAKKPWYRFAWSFVTSLSLLATHYYQRLLNKYKKSHSKRHLIVVDPTAFSGGSKIATESILRLLDMQKNRITVLSADPSSWQHADFKKVTLHESKWLAQQEQGIPYFLRHACIALNILLIRFRFGPVDLAVGASGPGVDLSLYLVRRLLRFDVIQLIHGPVAKSRTIARCLKAAKQVFYLHSTQDSLQSALSTLEPIQTTLPNHFQLLHNGLSKARWPSPCEAESRGIFWAASLLKWKGLDILIDALQKIPEATRPKTQICYIRPKGVQLPVSDAPVVMLQVDWHEDPENIDQLRAGANIFVSTSKNEPFGLSILEAMAAGQCVVIPADGAYWDSILNHNVDCIKYTPDDCNDLKDKLLTLSNDIDLVAKIGAQAAEIAQDYRAEKQYRNVVTCIEQASVEQTNENN